MTTTDERLADMYRRYAPGVFRRARRLLASDADAQDVVHDVFLSLFERPEQYQGRSSPMTFLYSATTNACLTRIRSAKNRQRLLRAYAMPAGEATAQPPLGALLDLHDTLRRMPERLARVAIYAWADELSHGEIALLIGCSRRHVANLLERIADWTPRKEELPCC